MAFFDTVKNTIKTGIKNTVKGVAEKPFAAPKAPSYTQPKKTAYQNITAKPVETKWYKGAVPTASEMEARAIKVGQQDYQRGEYLYGLFQETQNDPTSPLYNPYTKSTSQAASELSAMGFDVSDPNFIQNNAWLKGEYRLGTSGSPLAPSNSSTAEQNAAYWYNKYMDDEETTLKAEQEWAALQEEVGYWAGRKDRNLTDEEIFSKINWNNYPTLKRMDEAKGKGLSVGLTRPIGYSQDALNGVIYGKRNGVEGDPSRLAVRAAYDGSTGYQRNEEIASRLNPNSDMYNPYAVGSTIDDQALYFGVDSFDKDWVANNRQYMSSMDETERRMYNAVAKAEVNTSAAETEHDALMTYIDEQIAEGETDPDEIIEKVYGDGWGFDMAENGKTLAKMDESLEPGGTPMAMTRAVPYSRNDVERYIQERCEAENRKKGIDAVVGGLQSFMEKFLTPKELTATEKIAADTKSLVEKVAPPTEPEVPETTSEEPAAEDVELGLLPYTRKHPAETNAPAVKVDEVINPATAMAQMPANPVNPPNPEAMKVTASVVVSHGTDDEKKALKYHVANGSLANTRQFSNKMDRVTAGGMINHVADNYALTNGVQIRRADGASSHGENARLLAETEQIAAENAETIAMEKEYAEYVDGVGDISRVGKLNNLTDEQKESAKEYAYAVGIQRSSGDRRWEREAFEAMKASGMDEETIAFVQNIVSEWANDTGYSTDETNNGEVLEMRMEKVVDENPYEGLTPKSGELSEAEKKAAFLEDKIAEYKAGVAADEEYQKFIDKKPGLERLRSMANGAGGRQAYGGFDGIEDAIDYSFDVIEFVPPERKMNQDWQDARYMAEQSGIADVDSYMKQWAEKTIADYDLAIEKNNEILRYIKPDENGNVAIPGYAEDEIAAIEAETDRVERKKYETEMYLLTTRDDFDDVVQRVKEENKGPYDISTPSILLFGLEGKMNAGLGLVDDEDAPFVTDEEKDIILFLYDQYGEDAAVEYKNYLLAENTGVVNVRRSASVEEGWTQFTREAPILAIPAAILATPFEALGSIGFMAETLITGGKADPYSSALNVSVAKDAVNNTVYEWSEDTFGKGSTGEFLFNLCYGAVFSAGESLVMSVFTGGIDIGSNAQSVLGKFGFKAINSTLQAAPIASIGAQRTYREAYAQTGSHEKALMMAGVSFVAETFSESISIDNIRSAFKGGAEGTRRFLQELVPNTFEEGTGEMISAVIQQIGDDTIMGEYSKREGLIEKYHAEGMSLEDAAVAADKEILKNILYSGMTGALSAGVSTSVPYVAGRAGSNISKTENTETVSTPDYVAEQTVETVQGTEPVASNAFGGLAILAGVEGDDVNAQAKTEAVAAALVTSEEQMPSAVASAQEMNSEYGDEATRNFVVDVITKAGMNAQTAGAIVAASLSKGEAHQMLTSMVTGKTEVTPETVNQLVETAEADAQNPEIQGEIMGNIQRSVINNAVIDAGNAGGFNSIASQQTAVQTANQKLEEAKSVLQDEKHRYQALGESLNDAVAQFNADPTNQLIEALVTQIAKDMEGQNKMVKQAEQTVTNARLAVRNANKQLELTKATTLDNLRQQETQRIAEEAAQIDKNTEKVYNSDEVRNNAVQPGSINQGQEFDDGKLSGSLGRNDRRGNNLYAQSGTRQEAAGRGTESVAEHNRQDAGRVLARLLSKEANENLEKNGVTNQPLYMESDLERFSNALDEAKSSNDHGAYVDGQSVDSLKEKGAKIIMSEDGHSGAAVGTKGKEKGNIFGVFKSKQSKARKASAQLMIQAIANGGNKLDCFNGNLSVMYSSVGFIPVARVAFNEEYAPDGWNYERDGKPDVVFWVHNGDSADTVAQKYGSAESDGGYHIYSPEEIAVLPLFDDYEEAWNYRDSLLKEKTGSSKNYMRGTPTSGEGGEGNGKPKHSPQAIAKNMAKELGIGDYIGTRKMNNVPKDVLGYYETRAKYIAVRNKQAGNYAVTMHEIGHAIADKIGMTGTPQMVANLDPVFAANYKPAELPGEAFAEFVAYYMASEQAARNFAGDNFVDAFERALVQNGLDKAVNENAKQLRIWVNADAVDKIGAVIHSRDEGKKSPIKEQFRKLIAGTLDSSSAAESVASEIRKQSGEKEIPLSEDIRTQALLNNTAHERAFNIISKNLTNANWEVVGDSLSTVLDNAGITAKNMQLFERYMLALHSLDRDAQGKPVFDEHITTQERIDFIEKVQRENPEVARAEEAFQKWRTDFLTEFLVKTGRITQEELDTFNTMYPHYVPTQRVKGNLMSRIKERGGSKRYKVRSATGSTEDIWSPIDTFMMMVDSIVADTSANNMALAWDSAAQKYALGEFGRLVTPDVRKLEVDTKPLQVQIEEKLQGKVGDDVLQDVLDTIGEKQSQYISAYNENKPGSLLVYHPDGRISMYEMQDVELYKLLASVNDNTRNPVFEYIGKLLKCMAALTTGSNPVFAVRNFMRDFQNSVNYGSWASNYATGAAKWLRAAWDVFRENGDFQKYQALGGGGWTRIQAGTKKGAAEYRSALFKGYNTSNMGRTAKFAGQKLWNAITFARLNEIVEQTSRYAEFKYGKNDTSTAEGAQKAFVASQDTTVDFHRSGNSNLAKVLKQTIPFFGASSQGVYRTARMFSETERSRLPQRFAKTVINTGLMSLLANGILLKFLDDDEKKEYALMSDELKAQHIYLPNPNTDVFGVQPLIRIPLAQDPLTYAIHGVVTNAMWSDSSDELIISGEAIGNTILDSLNPFGSGTIFQPIIGIGKNENYYGGAIVPSNLTGLNDETLQYTEETPDLFVAAGRLFGMSPLKVQYLAEQYTGFLGQIAIPALSKDKNTGELGGLPAALKAVQKKFTSDPLVSNDVVSSFYDGYEEIEGVKQAAEKGKPLNFLRRGLTEEEATAAYTEAKELVSADGILGKTKKEISDLYKEIDEINANPTLSEEKKYVLTSDIRREIIEKSLYAQEAIGAYREKYVTGGNLLTMRFEEGVYAHIPTAYETLPDVFKADESESYMQAAKSVWESTGDDNALPHPLEEFEKKNAEGKKIKYHPKETGHWEEYEKVYHKYYRDYCNTNRKKLASDDEEVRLQVLKDAHSKAHSKAKEWYFDQPGVLE